MMVGTRDSIPVPYLVRPRAQLGTGTLSPCWLYHHRLGLTWVPCSTHVRSCLREGAGPVEDGRKHRGPESLL